MRRRSQDVLTVEQMATVVGVGRQTAYAQCRLWLVTDRADGIPCHRIGRLILVYRCELENWLGFAIAWPPADDDLATPPHAATLPTAATIAGTRATRRRPHVAVDQQTLPF